MIQFDTVEVLKTVDNFHYVTWASSTVSDDGTTPPTDTPDDYYYVIYWSNDPVSGYHSIKNADGSDVQIDGATGPLEFSVKHYRKQYDFNVTYMYVVVAYHKTIPNRAYKSKVSHLGQYSDGVHVQIRHAENILYNMYHGEPCLIIKKKSYGQKCPKCWSSARSQRTITNCPVCQSTGFTYGYYQPIPIQISFDSGPKKSDVQRDYENTTDEKRARLSNYPIVRPGDLVIKLDSNKRSVITHVENTKLPLRATKNGDVLGNKMSKQNYVLSQLLSLQEVPANDQEYFMNYNNIPEETEDYSLPRYQTHEPASGSSPIVIDDNQVVTLSISDDFEVTPDGKLALKNALESTASMFIEYALSSGVNGLVAIPSSMPNLIPDTSIITTLKGVKISSDRTGVVSDTLPATVRISEDDPNADDEYVAWTGVTKFVSDFAAAGSQVGVKYYTYYNVDASAGNVVMTPNKAMFVDIQPNGSWVFDTIRVTVELELRMDV